MWRGKLYIVGILPAIHYGGWIYYLFPPHNLRLQLPAHVLGVLFILLHLLLGETHLLLENIEERGSLNLCHLVSLGLWTGVD